MYPAGYYRSNYSALTVRELIRMGGLLRFPFDYFARRSMRPGYPVWMPGLWGEQECAEADLSERFWEAVRPYCEEWERLGFTRFGYSKIVRHLNPNYRDNGGISYLDRTRSHFGRLLYTRVYTPPPIDRDREDIVLVFSVVFENENWTSTNNSTFFDPPVGERVFRVFKADPRLIYERLVREISGKTVPRTFRD